jgi:ABC-type transport system involved in multi-copper enzyme maturation permease subunit
MKILWNMVRNEMNLAMHNKLIFLFILFSVMSVPVMYMFDFFSAEQEMKIIKDFTFSLVSLMGIIMAVFYPIFTIKEDLERKYIYSILSKPVSRWAYILGKFAGACAVITLVCALNFVILYLIVFVKKGDITLSYIEVSVLLLCKFYLIVAVSVLMAMLPFSFHISIILSIFVFVTGTLKTYVLTALRYSEGFAAAGLFKPLLRILPNFQVFDVYEGLIGGVRFTHGEFLKISGYATCYIMGFLLTAWIVMRRKEI